MAQSWLVLAQFGGAGGAGGSPYMTPLMIGGLFAIMYFVMIRPQQKQAKDHRELISALKKGDDVITQAGILGKIHAVTDKIVTLEIANGVRIRVLKSSVQGKTNLSDEPAVAKVEETKGEK